MSTLLKSKLIVGCLLLGALVSAQQAMPQDGASKTPEPAPTPSAAPAPDATAAAAADTEDDSNDITPTNPCVKSGLKLRVTGRKIVIGSGQMQIGSKLFDISPTKVEVPPAGILSVNDDILRFSDNGKPCDYAVLSKCRAALNDSIILRGVLVPGSVKLKASPIDGPRFSKNKEYGVQDTYGAIRLVPGGNIKQGDKVFADYQCWRRRIDTIAFDPTSAQFVLVQGIPARSAPEPPEIPSQVIPIANVYSDWGDGDITPDNVMAIAEKDFIPNTNLIEHNRKAMAPIIKKLEDGQPVHFVFWGDSVTQGFDARSKNDTFTHLFSKQIKTIFPKAAITCSNLGIINSSSASRLPSLKAEVFSLKPDVIIVEFVNDFALPAHVLQKDYEVLLDTAKEKNVRVILVAPSLVSPRIAKTVSWEAVMDKPLVPMLRELTVNNDYVALADVFSRFVHLKKEGLRPEIMYINGLHHPNNRGHAIYAEELLRCFASPNQIASQQQ